MKSFHRIRSALCGIRHGSCRSRNSVWWRVGDGPTPAAWPGEAGSLWTRPLSPSPSRRSEVMNWQSPEPQWMWLFSACSVKTSLVVLQRKSLSFSICSYRDWELLWGSGWKPPQQEGASWAQGELSHCLGHSPRDSPAVLSMCTAACEEFGGYGVIHTPC